MAIRWLLCWVLRCLCVLSVRVHMHRLRDLDLRVVWPRLIHGIVLRIALVAVAEWLSHHADCCHSIDIVKWSADSWSMR